MKLTETVPDYSATSPSPSKGKQKTKEQPSTLRFSGELARKVTQEVGKPSPGDKVRLVIDAEVRSVGQAKKENGSLDDYDTHICFDLLDGTFNKTPDTSSKSLRS